jgi:recombinational DNA repair ATPase RecF
VLDGIFGELDAARRNRLLANLPAGTQTIITTTFLNWAEGHLIENVFQLAEGRLS